MWKRHSSHDIRFKMKTHICKAYVKNVMHEGYEMFVAMAWASFVEYHRTRRKCWEWETVRKKDTVIKQDTKQHLDLRRVAGTHIHTCLDVDCLRKAVPATITVATCWDMWEGEFFSLFLFIQNCALCKYITFSNSDKKIQPFTLILFFFFQYWGLNVGPLHWAVPHPIPPLF